MAMTRIYLIRHAEAEGNIMRIFHGRHDGDISENGALQLEQLRERCRGLHFDAVYSSPLRRAFKTAQAADYYHGLPIILKDGLIEINGGCWEGCRWDDLPVLYPEENNWWLYEPWNFRVEGGETMKEVYDRIWETVTGIVRENEGLSVCVVSHGCAIRNFLCRAQGRPLEELMEVPWCDNTAISVIDFDEGLKPQITLLNDSSHLDEETSTFAKQDWWKTPGPSEGPEKPE
jgi:broad specificity phosphatase PhoE